MTEIKVNEEEYLYFLSLVKSYLEGHGTEEQKEQILGIIDKQQNTRILMLARKRYYDFYMRNKRDNPVEAEKAYQQYLQIKSQLERK